MPPCLILSNLLLHFPPLLSTNNQQLHFSPLPSLPMLKISNPKVNLRLPAITPLSHPQTHQTHEAHEAHEGGGGGGVLSSCFPSLAWANTLYFKSRNYNVKVIVDEEESEESLLRRFKREVMKAGVIQECKRRKFFENKRDKMKRKARDAAKRNRRRPYVPNVKWNNREVKKEEKPEEEDNWELPEGELPY